MKHVFWIKEKYKDGSLKTVWAVIDYRSLCFQFKPAICKYEDFVDGLWTDTALGVRLDDFDKPRYQIVTNEDEEYKNEIKKIRARRRREWELDRIEAASKDKGAQDYFEITKNGDVIGIR